MLSGRTAIVTGAGRGIGRAVAIELAREGAAVVVAAKTEAELGETVAQIKKNGIRSSRPPDRCVLARRYRTPHEND